MGIKELSPTLKRARLMVKNLQCAIHRKGNEKGKYRGCGMEEEGQVCQAVREDSVVPATKSRCSSRGQSREQEDVRHKGSHSQPQGSALALPMSLICKE